MNLELNFGALIWLFMAVLGTALLVGGFFLYRGSKTGGTRAMAAASMAAGVTLWALLLFTVPVSRSIEYQPGPAVELGSTPTELLPPPEAGVASSYGSLGDREGNRTWILDTEMKRAELLAHYQAQVQQKGWNVSPPLMNDDVTTLTWTYRDNNGLSHRGILTLTPAGPGQWLASETFVTLSP